MLTADIELKEGLQPGAKSPSDLQCNLAILLLLNLSLFLCRLYEKPFPDLLA